ncbi:hypothetical protein [Pararhizobium sp.]|uniref:hypothetical protein n=1 Tax=Pararhizobium sp. TaxID=1977563 RepID=UPI003D11DAEB
MQKKWWNPVSWMQFALEAIWSVLSGIWTAILGIFGIHPTAPRGAHENIKLGDVDDAAAAEADKQALADLMNAEMTPADVVLAYASAGLMDRPTVDLGKLTPEQQDWLVSLSDGDLALLSASGHPSCEMSLRALKAIPYLTKLRAESAPEAAPEPIVLQTKENLIRERYIEVVRGLHLSKKPFSRG